MSEISRVADYEDAVNSLRRRGFSPERVAARLLSPSTGDRLSRVAFIKTCANGSWEINAKTLEEEVGAHDLHASALAVLHGVLRPADAAAQIDVDSGVFVQYIYDRFALRRDVKLRPASNSAYGEIDLKVKDIHRWLRSEKPSFVRFANSYHVKITSDVRTRVADAISKLETAELSEMCHERVDALNERARIRDGEHAATKLRLNSPITTRDVTRLEQLVEIAKERLVRGE